MAPNHANIAYQQGWLGSEIELIALDLKMPRDAMNGDVPSDKEIRHADELVTAWENVSNALDYYRTKYFELQAKLERIKAIIG